MIRVHDGEFGLSRGLMRNAETTPGRSRAKEVSVRCSTDAPGGSGETVTRVVFSFVVIGNLDVTLGELFVG